MNIMIESIILAAQMQKERLVIMLIKDLTELAIMGEQGQNAVQY